MVRYSIDSFVVFQDRQIVGVNLTVERDISNNGFKDVGNQKDDVSVNDRKFDSQWQCVGGPGARGLISLSGQQKRRPVNENGQGERVRDQRSVSGP